MFKSNREEAAPWDAASQHGQAPAAPDAAASLHVRGVRAVLASVRRGQGSRARDRWPVWVSVTDARGTPVCEPLPTTLEALQGLREDLLSLGYEQGRMRGPGTYVFRHSHAVLRP